MLTRCYTQNIDGLERAAGVPAEALVECHGTMRTARCSRCNAAVKDMEAVWERAPGGKAPVCEHCNGTIRPDVVFFGEALHSRLQEMQLEDFQECNCLIVMGTSLKVYPFAGLVNETTMLTPRLLINNEAAGPWRGASVANAYRDVQWLGDCDGGVENLMNLLGWSMDS